MKRRWPRYVSKAEKERRAQEKKEEKFNRKPEWYKTAYHKIPRMTDLAEVDAFIESVNEEVFQLTVYGNYSSPSLYDWYKLRRMAKSRRKELVSALEQERAEAKRKQTEAAAAAHYGKIRESTDAVRNQLFDQIDVHPNCPYCDGPLGDTPHADHIYPVVRGGLSTPDNLVIVCSVCNGKKHDKTLREFVRDESLDWDRIVGVLETLGKRC